MKKLWQNWQKPLLVGIMFFVIFPVYMVINYYLHYQNAQGADLTSWVDRQIPFSPLWQFVYVSIYTFVLFPAVYIRDNATFRRTFWAFLLTQVMAFAIFYTFPTKILRGEAFVAQKEGFVPWGIRLNYKLDPPYNCFPSLHVGNSYVVAFSMLFVDPPVGVACFLWATLISYSTLAVKHHFFYDIVGGFLLAAIACGLFLAPHWRNRPPEKELRRERKVLLIPLFAYVFTLAIAYLLYLFGLPA